MGRLPVFPGKAIDPLKLKHLLLVLIGTVSIQPSVREARSCSVPVFRYALERWKPDPYKGIFIYRGAITERDRALLKQLTDTALNPECPVNLRIREVETAAFSEKRLRELLKGPIPEKLPVLAIWYPNQMGKTEPLWTLDLTSSTVKALTYSPKRRLLAESLIQGESIVWIFVPSGNSEKDKRAQALLQRELDLGLSSLAEMPPFFLSGSSGKKLIYGFQILTLSRTDPEERFFLDMLLKSESSLDEHKEEPMGLPVFGRGRLLAGIYGERISEKNIRGAISFLAASCSCDTKALNPGIDLLVGAPWDRAIVDYYADNTPSPELTGVLPSSPSAARQSATDPVEPDKPQKNSNVLATYGITLGSVAIVVVIAGFIVGHRRKRE
jgi:hypothetical protein